MIVPSPRNALKPKYKFTWMSKEISSEYQFHGSEYLKSDRPPLPNIKDIAKYLGKFDEFDKLVRSSEKTKKKSHKLGETSLPLFSTISATKRLEIPIKSPVDLRIEPVKALSTRNIFSPSTPLVATTDCTPVNKNQVFFPSRPSSQSSHPEGNTKASFLGRSATLTRKTSALIDSLKLPTQQTERVPFKSLENLSGIRSPSHYDPKAHRTAQTMTNLALTTEQTWENIPQILDDKTPTTIKSAKNSQQPIQGSQTNLNLRPGTSARNSRLIYASFGPTKDTNDVQEEVCEMVSSQVVFPTTVNAIPSGKIKVRPLQNIRQFNLFRNRMISSSTWKKAAKGVSDQEC